MKTNRPSFFFKTSPGEKSTNGTSLARERQHPSIFGGLVFIVLLFSSCAGPVRHIHHSNTNQNISSTITLTYLGVGGWLIQNGSHRLMTAPFYSNPSTSRVGLGRIRPEPALIERFLPDVNDVEAILVGHAHYDHTLDLPYIATHRAPAAMIYGNQTMKHLLAHTLPAEHLHAVDADAATEQRMGQWIWSPSRAFRFMPIISEHAPHVGKLKFFRGHLTQDEPRLPQYARRFKEGQTLAFLIDLMDGERVLFRIYYQDAASGPGYGLPPPLNDGHRVDVAILCVASFSNVKGYPEKILRALEPRHVLLGHWEDFFRPQTKPLRVVPLTRLDKFLPRLTAALPRDADWFLPHPYQPAPNRTGVFAFPAQP